MPKRCRPLLGTFVEITADREEAIESAFDAVDQVHRLMSAHERNSDLSRINRFAHLRSIEVHELTARVLERALYWARESGGAFDPLRAGSAAIRHNLMPCHADQPQPEAAHWTWLELQGCSVRLMKPACIDLGGIAKGFAVDRAIDALRRAGCERGLVNAGGDLRGFGAEAWPVTIVDPLARSSVAALELKDAALATSAGLPDTSGAGLSFDHLGGSNPRWTSVSVVARSGCDADALTKIVWCATTELGSLLAAAGARALAICHDGRVEPVCETAEVDA
ncbi:MAG: FAD:protein FMN transferase [Sphingomonas sp.]|nr:FAD:protein FMN transferase [Sphingomonas sp.]